MIAEPTSALGLWPLVRARSSSGWPSSDEDRARRLAENWRTAALHLRHAGDFNVAPTAAYWPDNAGRQFVQRVRGELNAARDIGDAMEGLANRVDHFADVVTGVKSAIRDLIDLNLDRYNATNNFPPEERGQIRESFVSQLARDVDGLVARGVEQLGGSPPPPPPMPEPGLLSAAGAVAGSATEVVGALTQALLDNPQYAIGLSVGTAAVAAGSVLVAGGGAISLSGGGAAVGVPTAAAGYGLAGLGAVTVVGSAEGLVAAASAELGDSDGKATSNPQADPVQWDPGERAREKIPSEWNDPGAPNRKRDGVRWHDENDQGNGVRIDRGNPNSSQPSQRVDHVVVRDNGVVIGRDGNPIQGSIKANGEMAHIPLSEWEQWGSWNKP